MQPLSGLADDSRVVSAINFLIQLLLFFVWLDSSLFAHVTTSDQQSSPLLSSVTLSFYTVSGTRCHYIFASNFGRCCPIYKICSLADF